MARRMPKKNPLLRLWLSVADAARGLLAPEAPRWQTATVRVVARAPVRGKGRRY